MPALHWAHSLSILDHLVELSLVGTALEEDICPHLLADTTKQTDEERKAVITPIIRAANNPTYNLFLIPARIEQFVSWEMTAM